MAYVPIGGDLLVVHHNSQIPIHKLPSSQLGLLLHVRQTLDGLAHSRVSVCLFDQQYYQKPPVTYQSDLVPLSS